MACFSETFNNPTMWAHYGDNYRGICIEYDVEKLIKSLNEYNKKINSEKSNVKEVNLESKLLKVKYNPLTEINDLFDAASIKTSEWSYEKEWRVITQGLHNEFTINSETGTALPTYDSITKIFLGPKIDHASELALHYTLFGNSNNNNVMMTSYQFPKSIKAQ